MQVVIGFYEYNSTASPGTFVIDNFNIAPTPVSTVLNNRTLLGVGT